MHKFVGVFVLYVWHFLGVGIFICVYLIVIIVYFKERFSVHSFSSDVFLDMEKQNKHLNMLLITFENCWDHSSGAS